MPAQPVPAQPPHLKFVTAFWLLASLVAINQIFQLWIFLAHYDWSLDALSDDYYSYSFVGGIIWYGALTLSVLTIIDYSGPSALELFRLKWSAVTASLGKLLKYFGGCAATVLILSLLMPPSDLELGGRSTTGLLGVFILTVVLAPIIEEMAFRGYLYNAQLNTFKRTRERLVVNAMLFAAAHVFLAAFLIGESVPYYIFVIGYLLARLYEDTRSILPGILLHAANNGLVFALELGYAEGLIPDVFG